MSNVWHKHNISASAKTIWLVAGWIDHWCWSLRPFLFRLSVIVVPNTCQSQCPCYIQSTAFFPTTSWKSLNQYLDISSKWLRTFSILFYKVWNLSLCHLVHITWKFCKWNKWKMRNESALEVEVLQHAEMGFVATVTFYCKGKQSQDKRF